MNIKLTKEEKKAIYKVYNLILDDMNELQKISKSNKIDIWCDFKYKSSYPHIALTDKAIVFYSSIDSYHYFLEEKGPIRTKRNNVNISTMIALIENYESIRSKLKSEIEKSTSEKETFFHKLAQINKKYTKEAEIEIDLPPSQNVHEIEIIEEEGKNIGIINFGNRTIKIITDGDIVLVNRKKSKLQKYKKK